MSKKGELTAKQRLFAFEYTIDQHIENAAIRAGYSKKTAYSIGSEIKQKPHVQAFIDELMAKRFKKLEIKGETVLERLDIIGRVDPRLAYDENNCLLPMRDMPDEIAFAIEQIETFEEFDLVDGRKVKIGETVKIKFNSKIKSNELLGKNQKLFTDKLDLNGKLKLEDLVAGSGEDDESQD